MLDQILATLPKATDSRVLVGTEDDAGVYRLTDDLALVQTADFFTPVVDDPYDFGAIAATNALSDVYAMGARPITALNLVAYPKDGPLDVLAEIMRGGLEKAAEAGVSVIGGHSIDDREPKYGMAVTGVIDPRQLVLKSGGRPGDRLVLTKPLGTGVVATAVKEGRAPAEVIAAAAASMKTLNRAAAEAMGAAGVRGATDVTGFGLLGHLHELAFRSGVTARLSLHAVPFLPGIAALAQVRVPGGTRTNLRYVNDWTTWTEGITEEQQLMLADAQTSGGLLIAVPAAALDGLLADLAARGVATAAVIGELGEGEAGRMTVVP